MPVVVCVCVRESMYLTWKLFLFFFLASRDSIWDAHLIEESSPRSSLHTAMVRV